MLLYKQSRDNPGSPQDQPVGTTGLFREFDFFCKSKQENNLPDSHEFDERIITAFEFLYQIFSIRFGERVKPKFTSTFRIPGDPNYKTASGKLSYHASGKAADANWNHHAQEIEDYIVCVIGYDIETGGHIYQRLTEIGIKGFGTYFREGEGTFLHLDTRENFQYFRKIKRYKLAAAEKWHDEFMKLAFSDNNINSELNAGQIIPDEKRSYELMNTDKTLLWFKSDNCRDCETMSNDFYNWQEQNADVELGLWGIDVTNKTPSDKEALEKYNVSVLPTLLFLQDGIEVSRIEGVATIPEMQESLDQLTTIKKESFVFKSLERKAGIGRTVRSVKTSMGLPVGLVKDGGNEIVKVFRSSDEDPFIFPYQIFQWIVRILLIMIVVFGIIRFARKQKA